MHSHSSLFRHLERCLSDCALYAPPRQLRDSRVLDLAFLQWTIEGSFLETQGAEIA